MHCQHQVLANVHDIFFIFRLTFTVIRPTVLLPSTAETFVGLQTCQTSVSYRISMPISCLVTTILLHGPLLRYVKLCVVHAPGMPPPRLSNPDMHHGTCVTHVPWCMLGSLTSGFLWSRWWGKRSRHSGRMRNSQFYVSGKRPKDLLS